MSLYECELLLEVLDKASHLELTNAQRSAVLLSQERFEKLIALYHARQSLKELRASREESQS